MPTIEYVTVANHAEAINGLLYLQGAGWTDMSVVQQPNGMLGPVHLGLAVSILLGWNETNSAFPFEIQVVGEDGGEPLMGATAQLEQGRPAGLAPGADLRSVIALNGEVMFPQAGGYEVRAQVGDQLKTVSFRVHAAQMPPMGPPGPSGPPDPGSFQLPQW